MITDSIIKLEYLCNTIPQLLLNIDDRTFLEKNRPNQWSKKEILGHLIDSATNNHQRFIRGQFEDKPAIVYDQNKWNQFNFYQQINAQQLIAFWEVYNRQLIELLKHISNESLQLECLVDGNLLTIDFLVNDYVEHLEYHLKQIVLYQ
ncbi:MAG: DinB family protein [Sphingobacteriales bacterium]|nr:MAG: DinB family protein [Sphingobacteriales bacterium]